MSRGPAQAALGHAAKGAQFQSRLEKIVDDILLDMETRPRLMSGRGNAMLVSGSIYQACKFYELFTSQGSASAPSSPPTSRRLPTSRARRPARA